MQENENQNNFIKKENSSNFNLKNSQMESISSFSKSKILSNLFNSFSNKEINKFFDSMSTDLINYRIEQENMDKKDMHILKEKSIKNVLYNLLEKHLIEIIYINNQHYREERINKIYKWYHEQLKRFNDTKCMNKKSYKEPGSIDDEEYFREKIKQMKKENSYFSEDSFIKEQISHRSQGAFDTKMLKEFKRVQLFNTPFFKKIKKQINSIKEDEEHINTITSAFLKANLSQPHIVNNPVRDYSTFYSSCNGTNFFSLKKNNENKTYEKPEGGEKERTFYSGFDDEKKYISQEINKEAKFSYSFNRPPGDFNILNAEKKIIEYKNINISEKRAKEEFNKKIEEYGITRAHYKENMLKKNELKNIINMYVKTKKINTKLLKKYKQKQKNILNILALNKNNFNSKIGTHVLLKNRVSLVNNNNISNSNSYMIPKITLQKNINPVNNQDDSIINLNEKNKIDERPKTDRVLKRYLTFGDMHISKKLRRKGDKLILNEIQNLNNKTKEIIDNPKDQIHFFDITLKFQKDIVKQNLLKMKISKDNDNAKVPNDLVYSLISQQPIFNQKMFSENLCDVNAKINDKKYQKEPLSEEQSIYQNFSLSAYNSKNIHINNKNNYLENDIKILRHISPYSKTIGRKKLIDENDSFDKYRDNYLNLRKTIGEWKKYEFERFLNDISQSNKNEGKNDNNLNLYKEKKNKIKDAFIYKINHSKYKKQKILMNAIVNPNEQNTFPKLYLPKGGNLLSKIEIKPLKKSKYKK